jgi:hypothetical protein
MSGTLCRHVSGMRVRLIHESGQDVAVPNDAFHALESRLRQMSPQDQRQTAIELASVVLPLADLSTQGQPHQGLSSVADAIRAQTGITEADEARHALLTMPEMGRDEEPEGLAWFTFGASVAWVYAADANTTSPSDGVVHTFNRVSDLLDAIDDVLGDTGLLNQLIRTTGDTGRTPESWSTLAEGVRIAVDRLRSQ